MLTGSDVLYGGFLPGIVAAVVFAVVWRVTARAASAWRTALVAGYVLGHWALDAKNIGVSPAILKSLRVTEARDWLPLLACLSTVPDAVAAVGKFGHWLGWLLRVGLCVFVPWRLFYGSSYLPIDLGLDFEFDFGGWSTAEAVGWIGGIGATLLLVWQLACLGGRMNDIVTRSALTAFVALGGAVTLALSDSMTLGQHFGALTAALTGCGVTAMILPTRRGPDAAAGAVVTIFGALLLLGHFYAGLAKINAALLLISMTVASGWFPLPSGWLPRWQSALRSFGVLALVGLTITLAALKFAATQTTSEPEVLEDNPYQNFQR